MIDHTYSHIQPDEWIQQFSTCDDIHTEDDLQRYGASRIPKGRILTAFNNVCDVGRTCTIWKVGNGNDMINGLKDNLCDGYFAFNGTIVIAWLNFNNYVRTHFCIDIK